MEIEKMRTNAKEMVVMHNDLIRGRSDLSLHELKLIRLAIMQVVKEDSDFRTCKISVPDLAKLFGTSQSNLYRTDRTKKPIRYVNGKPVYPNYIQTVCDSLMSKPVYVFDGSDWKNSRWVITSEYKHQDKSVILTLHPDLKPYLLELSKLYTQYVLQNILKLNSPYSIRLYELIEEAKKNRRMIGEDELTVYISADAIREATDTRGKYKQAGSFRQKIIDKSVDEINEKLSTDGESNYMQWIKVDNVTEGHKVIGYNFTLSNGNRPDHWQERAAAKKKS